MNRKLYVIWDNKASDYLGPATIVAAAPEVAIRIYNDTMRSAPHMFNHAEDYDLLEIGEIENADLPAVVNTDGKTILTGAAWKAAQPKDA